MKTKIFLFTLINSLCFLSIISNAQTPAWLWAKSAKGMGNIKATSVALDNSGNTYMAGYFESPTIIFNPDTLKNTSISDTADIFLTKYDANGNILWAKSAKGRDIDRIYSVAVDASGNIYVAGYFESHTIIFGSDTLTNANIVYGSLDIFLVKYNANGNVLWAKSVGGQGDEEATSVAVDASGNAYVTGIFDSSTLTFGSYTLTNVSMSENDIFLAKFDVNGNVLWAKSAGGTYPANASANSVAVDVSGNAYITGSFQSSTIIFGSDTLTSAGYVDLFLAKYNTNGNMLWAKRAGGIYNDVGVSVAADASGNIYVTGNFQSPTITFDSDTLTSLGGYGYDTYLAKYDTYGNVLWAKSAGGTSDDAVTSIAVNASGNAYITGWFESSTITFGSNILTNTNSFDDIFYVKYDASGNVIWATKFGSTGDDMAYSIAMDVSGNACLVGSFNSYTLSFGSATLTNPDGKDIFLAKSGNIVIGINELNNSLNISAFPNPVVDNIIIRVPEIATSDSYRIEILNISGQIIKTIYNNGKETTIDLKNLPSGVYIIKAKTDEGIAIKKFIKE